MREDFYAKLGEPGPALPPLHRGLLASIALLLAALGVVASTPAGLEFFDGLFGLSAAADARGQAGLERNDYECAVKEFTQATNAFPGDIRYRYHLAIALAKAQRLDQARVELETVLRLDPRHIEARELLKHVDRAIAARDDSRVK